MCQVSCLKLTPFGSDCSHPSSPNELFYSFSSALRGASLGIALYIMPHSYSGSRPSGHTRIAAWIAEGKGRRVACLNRNFAGPYKNRDRNTHPQTAISSVLPFQSSVFGKSVSFPGGFPAYLTGPQWTFCSGGLGDFWKLLFCKRRKNPKTLKIPETRNQPYSDEQRLQPHYNQPSSISK